VPILRNKKNIQGLPVTERVNYEFVKATTSTDEFKCVSFIIPTLHALFIRGKQELHEQVIIDLLLFIVIII